MEEIFMQISNFGFPIVVSVYLLVRLDSKIESLSNSIQKLAICIENLK